MSIRTKIAGVVLLILFAFMTSGCFLYIHYETRVATCRISNSGEKISLLLDRDKSVVKDDIIPLYFVKACEQLKNDFNAASLEEAKGIR